MRRYKVLKLIFLGVFSIALLYLTYFILVDRPKVQSNVYNPRKIEAKGTISTYDGKVVGDIMSYKDEDGTRLVKRVYNDGNQYAHILGDISKNGQVAGVESKYRMEFENNNIFYALRDVLFKKEGTGNDIVLTIDSGLQKVAYEEMKKLGSDIKGAVVAIEPDTGKILAMVSLPDFDPNDLVNSREISQSKLEQGVFYNRALRGLYPPASTFKVITALAGIRELEDYKTFKAISNVETDFIKGKNKVTVREYNRKGFGLVDMPKAITESSNIYFAKVADEIGADAIKDVADDFYLNERIEVDRFITEEASILEDKSYQELILESFGQGKALVTPLHNALVAATIANDGVMMQPYLIDSVKDPSGREIDKTFPKVKGTPMTVEESKLLGDMMVNVVAEGTGRAAAIKGVDVAGKTGTAQLEKGDPHGWFIGFASQDKPKIAVAVVVENREYGSREASNIAGKIMSQWLRSAK